MSDLTALWQRLVQRSHCSNSGGGVREETLQEWEHEGDQQTPEYQIKIEVLVNHFLPFSRMKATAVFLQARVLQQGGETRSWHSADLQRSHSDMTLKIWDILILYNIGNVGTYKHIIIINAKFTTMYIIQVIIETSATKFMQHHHWGMRFKTFILVEYKLVVWAGSVSLVAGLEPGWGLSV